MTKREPILPQFNYVDDVLPNILLASHTVTVEQTGERPWWITKEKWDAFHAVQRGKYLSGEKCISTKFYDPYLTRHFAIVLMMGLGFGAIFFLSPLLVYLLAIKILGDFDYISIEWATITGREIVKYLALFGTPIACLIGMTIFWRRRWQRVLQLRSIHRFKNEDGINLFHGVDRSVSSDHIARGSLLLPKN